MVANPELFRGADFELQESSATWLPHIENCRGVWNGSQMIQEMQRSVWALDFRMSSHLDDHKSKIGSSGIQSHLAAKYQELQGSVDVEVQNVEPLV